MSNRIKGKKTHKLILYKLWYYRIIDTMPQAGFQPGLFGGNNQLSDFMSP